MCDTCGCASPGGEHLHEDRQVSVNQSLLSHNEAHAAENRSYFHNNGVLCVNLISSPGSGKTSLMEETARRLKEKYRLGFLIGDLETERDAERVRKQGVSAFQLTTAGACHLEAPLIMKGYDHLKKEIGGDPDILFIENVGNLVCPSSYDLGEEIRVVMVSTPEGDDKPAKYPTAFRSSHVFMVTKIDIAEYLDFDMDKVEKEAVTLNPYLETFRVSSKTGEGIDGWIEFIEQRFKRLKDHVSGHSH